VTYEKYLKKAKNQNLPLSKCFFVRQKKSTLDFDIVKQVKPPSIQNLKGVPLA